MTSASEPRLLGASLAEVCAALGAPLGCAFDGDALSLTYLGPRGDADALAVRLVDGVVFSAGRGLLRSPESLCDAALVGRSLEQALPLLGAPLAVTSQVGCARLEYEDKVVTVYEGVVACVEPRLPSVFVPTPRASA